eukprot:5870092-Alexandrium_andersonii.AAC.1
MAGPAHEQRGHPKNGPGTSQNPPPRTPLNSFPTTPQELRRNSQEPAGTFRNTKEPPGASL